MELALPRRSQWLQLCGCVVAGECRIAPSTCDLRLGVIWPQNHVVRNPRLVRVGRYSVRLYV
jgi:hypothetical protein